MISSILSKKIVVEKGTSGVTAVTSPALSYTYYITIYSNVYVRSSVTNYNENEDITYTTEFTIRYNNFTKAINNKYRILYNNQYYRIIEVIETEPKQTIKIIAVHFGE